ncbi:putative RNA-directed DNA polymerase [Arabidopsis thaliana]
MTKEFEMSLCGELTYFLGLQIKQTEHDFFISQSTYAKNLVERYGLKGSKTTRTPMDVTDKLSKDEEGEDVDERVYRGMIESLLYLTTSRPYICLAVGVCARYKAKTKASHMLAIKRIIKYVNGTVNLGLYYTKDTTRSLMGYCDGD